MSSTERSSLETDDGAPRPIGWSTRDKEPHRSTGQHFDEEITCGVDWLRTLRLHGGPTQRDYRALDRLFHVLWLSSRDHVNFALDALKHTLVPECVHGWGYLKPLGYAGDHIIIDRIYTHWISADESLAHWDRYFHAQPAPRAVRNRKAFFLRLLSQLPGDKPQAVLNVGSGPGRDVAEFLASGAHPGVAMTCIEHDARAIDHARSLCCHWRDRLSFIELNALRFRPRQTYDLIWSAGLFDYLSDRQFVALAGRLYRSVRPGGRLVVGNFGPHNPSRAYMEVLGRWYLNYRSRYELMHLAHTAGIPAVKRQEKLTPFRH